MGAKISRWILGLLGWKFKGEYPSRYRKLVLIVMPHTSNWDFPLGLLVRNTFGARIRFVGKDSLFRFPHGWLFYWLGGIPVDRSKRNQFVHAVADEFQKRQELVICIAPEGTRKKVDQLKTGFYFIALEAQVPILMVSFDYGTKTIGISEPFFPSGDFSQDLEKIREFYRGVLGKHPELTLQL